MRKASRDAPLRPNERAIKQITFLSVFLEILRFCRYEIKKSAIIPEIRREALWALSHVHWDAMGRLWMLTSSRFTTCWKKQSDIQIVNSVLQNFVPQYSYRPYNGCPGTSLNFCVCCNDVDTFGPKLSKLDKKTYFQIFFSK